MKDRTIENEVIRRWQERTPMRRIAAELRISRYLVKRIILDQQKGRAEGAAHFPCCKTLVCSRQIVCKRMSFLASRREQKSFF